MSLLLFAFLFSCGTLFSYMSTTHEPFSTRASRTQARDNRRYKTRSARRFDRPSGLLDAYRKGRSEAAPGQLRIRSPPPSAAASGARRGKAGHRCHRLRRRRAGLDRPPPGRRAEQPQRLAIRAMFPGRGSAEAEVRAEPVHDEVHERSGCEGLPPAARGTSERTARQRTITKSEVSMVSGDCQPSVAVGSGWLRRACPLDRVMYGDRRTSPADSSVKTPPRSRRIGPRSRRSRCRLPAIPRARVVRAVRRA